MKLRFHKRDVVGNLVVDTSQISEDVFETMVFRIIGGKIDYSYSVDSMTYLDEQSASKGHEEILKKWS